MTTMIAPIGRETSSPVEVRFGSPRRQRRVTVFFRFILVVPHSIVLFFVGIAALPIMVIAWFGALFTGRVPEFAAEFLAGYLRWTTRVLAYEYLITDEYPPFSLQPSPDFPIDLMVRTGQINRWSILFRYFLAIPGSIAAVLVAIGMYVFGIVTWITTLIKGTTPNTIFEANAAAIRYLTRFNGYFYMLTSSYPAHVLGDTDYLSDFPPPPPSPLPPVPPPIDPGFASTPPPPSRSPFRL